MDKKVGMVEITLPGKTELTIENLVLDYNGTLAVDGKPLPGIKEKIREVSSLLKVFILTSDTHHSVRSHLEDLPVSINILSGGDHSREKGELIQKIGADHTIAIGNGNNDRLMLKIARIGIAVMLAEGLSAKTLANADLVFSSIFDAAKDLISTEKVDAIMTASQSITLGTYMAILSMGLKIPDDVAIFGYDDLPWMEAVNPPISTTHQPIEELATKACEILFSALDNGGESVQSYSIDTHLIIRDSCGCNK